MTTQVADNFAQNLARIRTNAGMTQEELAERTQMEHLEIAELERGDRVTRVDTLLRLAAALEVQPGEFLSGIRWTPGEQVPGHFEIEEVPED